MLRSIVLPIPADGFLRVCTCGHVMTCEKDETEHMASHYDSYKVGLARRSYEAMKRIYPKRFLQR